jgi:hypothetical protein
MCNRWSGVRPTITRRGSKEEVKGGLYKVITRDNNRRKIFEAATIENRKYRRPDPRRSRSLLLWKLGALTYLCLAVIKVSLRLAWYQRASSSSQPQLKVSRSILLRIISVETT